MNKSKNKLQIQTDYQKISRFYQHFYNHNPNSLKLYNENFDTSQFLYKHPQLANKLNLQSGKRLNTKYGYNVNPHHIYTTGGRHLSRFKIILRTNSWMRNARRKHPKALASIIKKRHNTIKRLHRQPAHIGTNLKKQARLFDEGNTELYGIRKASWMHQDVRTNGHIDSAKLHKAIKRNLGQAETKLSTLQIDSNGINTNKLTKAEMKGLNPKVLNRAHNMASQLSGFHGIATKPLTLQRQPIKNKRSSSIHSKGYSNNAIGKIDKNNNIGISAASNNNPFQKVDSTYRDDINKGMKVQHSALTQHHSIDKAKLIKIKQRNHGHSHS